MIETGGHIPVHISEIIAVLVFPDFTESHAPAFKSRMVFPGKDMTRQTFRLNLDLPYFL